jgi:hypothetical protein
MRRLGRPRRRYAKLTRTSCCSENPVHSVCDAEASSGEHIHNDEQGVAAHQRITERGVGPLSEQPEPRGASDPQRASKTRELGRTRPAQRKKASAAPLGEQHAALSCLPFPADAFPGSRMSASSQLASSVPAHASAVGSCDALSIDVPSD